MSVLTLAKAVIATAEMFEQVFDHTLAAKLRARHETSLKNGHDYLPHFEQCHKVAVYQAAQKAAGEYAQPVYLMLNSHWNDAIYWANETIGASTSGNAAKAEQNNLGLAYRKYLEQCALCLIEGEDHGALTRAYQLA